jgi:hypothetical protein
MRSHPDAPAVPAPEKVEQVTVNGSLSDVYSGKLAGHALTNEFDAL